MSYSGENGSLLNLCRSPKKIQWSFLCCSLGACVVSECFIFTLCTVEWDIYVNADNTQGNFLFQNLDIATGCCLFFCSVLQLAVVQWLSWMSLQPYPLMVYGNNFYVRWKILCYLAEGSVAALQCHNTLIITMPPYVLHTWEQHWNEVCSKFQGLF